MNGGLIMDCLDYVFEDFGLDSDKFLSFPEDSILLPIP
jgi:hypothetical protein